MMELRRSALCSSTAGGKVTHKPSTGCAAPCSRIVEHRVVEEEVQEGGIDQEEDEPLTGESPDSEEEEGNNLNGDDPPPGMPSQIPTDKEIPKDYMAIKC
jgi:hypothetical protein